MKEPFLEPILRKMRIAKVLPILRRFPECKLLDVGCGWEAKFLKSVEPYIASGVGIDFKAPSLESAKLKTITATLDNKLPFEDGSFDVVSLMAVLEHLERPLDILKEIHRVLKKGGVLVGTVPSKAAKPVLEFLSYKLGVVSEAEIKDHKRYFNKKDLAEIFAEAGFREMKHRYFQFGMNNFFVVAV
ncbi:MAG: class I SAM-dependent methyltransferase [Fibromonadaceae bacterium]|jgi:ubiquinone/menaquinone biosynthesis C-methylase UbiE|nr:class I SAM-dependent methyltransferase [Fibromonadaceae bacterium]